MDWDLGVKVIELKWVRSWDWEEGSASEGGLESGLSRFSGMNFRRS